MRYIFFAQIHAPVIEVVHEKNKQGYAVSYLAPKKINHTTNYYFQHE